MPVDIFFLFKRVKQGGLQGETGAFSSTFVMCNGQRSFLNHLLFLEGTDGVACVMWKGQPFGHVLTALGIGE